MRVLCIAPGADFSVADVHRGYVKGLRACGVQVAEYNMNDRLVFFANCLIGGKKIESQQIVEHAARGIHEQMWTWWPDLVVVISGFYVMPITWEILRARPHKTAIVFTESPYEDDRQLNLVQAAEPDVVILNDPINIDRYRAIHNHVEYLPHCYDPDIHFPAKRPPVHDFSFVGTGYPSRIRLFEKVDWDGIDAKFAGHWSGLEPDSPLVPFLLQSPDDCYPNDEAADLYRASRMSANLYRGKDPVEANAPDLQEGWAVGPREIELAACQLPFLRESRGEGDALFPVLPTFTEAGEMSEQLHWWLSRDDIRAEAGKQIAEAVADRRFEKNAARLLRMVERS